MKSIRKTCNKYKLKFCFRMTFVNRYTVRLLGEMIPEGPNRGEGTGSPAISVLDEAKKDKHMKRAGTDWSREGRKTGISQQMAKQQLEDLKVEIKDNEEEQQAASNLLLARKTVDTAFLDWSQREELRTARATQYALQRISTTRPNNDPPSSKANYDARPTWTKLAGEAKTENLYIDCLLDAVLADPTRGIGFDADDPGLLVDKLEGRKSSEEQQQATIKLPPVHYITAPQISDMAFTTKNQRRRERRLAANTPETDAARSALGALSSGRINAVSTLEDVDHA
ncbi:hypothetical protein EC957_000026 [Mortierella hygrophila]|uniref:Uncharacterized protein n=1 Tax=Mortierella hygrophila TaxID=979708 RepID=A0A9P6K8X3_9FUNG|nr:hypothetical protein EC957_000026 [Mortierella hygrophila]